MFMQPMLLEKRDQPFDDDRYIFEPKIDGHRLILSHINGETRMYTRHQTEVTRQYPELWHPLVDGNVALDGEVACLDPETDNFDFEAIMERFQMRKADRIQSAILRQPICFVVFDILWHNGKDMRKYSLMDRKALLNEVLEDRPNFGKVSFVEGRGTELFQTIKERSMEGIVAKRIGSTYIGRRSSDWLKIVNYQYTDVYISGFRKKEFGWLVKAQNQDGQLQTAGIVELAVPTYAKQAFYGISKQLITGEDRNYVYMDPRIKAKVKFRNWTKNGMLRTPAFVDFVL